MKNKSIFPYLFNGSMTIKAKGRRAYFIFLPFLFFILFFLLPIKGWSQFDMMMGNSAFGALNPETVTPVITEQNTFESASNYSETNSSNLIQSNNNLSQTNFNTGSNDATFLLFNTWLYVLYQVPTVVRNDYTNLKNTANYMFANPDCLPTDVDLRNSLWYLADAPWFYYSEYRASQTLEFRVGIHHVYQYSEDETPSYIHNINSAPIKQVTFTAP